MFRLEHCAKRGASLQAIMAQVNSYPAAGCEITEGKQRLALGLQRPTEFPPNYLDVKGLVAFFGRMLAWCYQVQSVAGQREVHRDLSFDFHRFIVQNVRPVAPLAHGVDSRLDQHRMPSHNFKVLNRALLADHGL